MTASQLRKLYFDFFTARGHKIIPSASLIPENDPSVLFTTAGMHPLVPFLMGEGHPAGRRLVDVQKCVRVNDIDEVGDASHHTFFEMLGNWSLGDYFKSEAIAWSYEFLTSKKYLGLNPARLAVTCFAGDADAPRDQEAARAWAKAGIPAERIFFLPKNDNWWGPAGLTGPCGPDTEMFYDVAPQRLPCSPGCGPGCACGKYVEIWNDVFMQYEKKDTGTEVIFLRHGQTDGNQQLRMLGSIDMPLNPAGVKEAEAFRKTVADFKPDVILTSPLERAMQTAKIIAPGGVPVVAEPLALERNPGQLEGMNQAEILAACPGAEYIKKRGINYCVNPPDGESLEQAKKRVEKLFGEILRRYRGQKVIIVSHGDLLDMSLAVQKSLSVREAIGTHPATLAQERYRLYEYRPLRQKNVDTGMGLERTLAVLNGLDDNYRTELFWPLIEALQRLSGKKYGENERDTFAFRVIADHWRAATFILGDEKGVTPSNVEQGYILRRLIRRAVRFGKKLGITAQQRLGRELANVVIKQYAAAYPELAKNQARIITELEREENKFEKTLEKGLREFQKLKDKGISGKEAFDLFQTYGFPIEMTQELAKEHGVDIDQAEFDKQFKIHQNISRQGSAQKFSGGLGEKTVETTRLHTATHLLHSALRQVLGSHVEQRGSNITAERLRFDFSHPSKLTAEQKQAVEDLVNQQIQAALPMKKEIMTVAAAKQQGAMGLFEHKYGDQVSVYSAGNFTKEICGGPHVTNTRELGHFRIKKEEASSAGVRRIKATLG